MASPRRRKPRYLPLKEPRQARARITYESLLDAAARLLAARGYAALTTNHVAEAAGVAIGSLYEYFPDKQTVVAEVVRRTLREIRSELADSVGEALVRAGGDGLEAALRAMVAALFRVVERRAALVRVITREVPFLRELAEVDRLSDELIEIAARARPLGKRAIFAERPEAATFVLTVMVANTVLEAVAARSRQEREDIEAALVEMLLILLTPGR